MELKEGNRAPDFCIGDQNDEKVCLSDLMGKWTILYFYPKDNTPGCTKEAREFTRALNEFRGMGAEIIGVSPDTGSSHTKFIDKHDLKLRLLSDTNHDLLESCGTWVKKSMFGKKYMGVERSTLIIDPEGRIRKIWRKVKVDGHVDEVRETLKKLTTGTIK